MVRMDYRVSQRRPFASLTGRCGPVMTGKMDAPSIFSIFFNALTL
jgi:hypothetical protein